MSRDPDAPRLAVLGVPRGGTSMVTGLARILGLSLPPAEFEPVCEYGEARWLRYADPEHGGDTLRILGGLATLPGGTVWKDPAVSDYAEHVDWSSWYVVHVRRDARDVAASERRHGHLAPLQEHRARAVRRYADIDVALWRQGVEPDLSVTFEEVAHDPLRVLGDLSRVLHLNPPTVSQDHAAVEFVRPGGYRCPVPETCTLEHPQPPRRRRRS